MAHTFNAKKSAIRYYEKSGPETKLTELNHLMDGAGQTVPPPLTTSHSTLYN